MQDIDIDNIVVHIELVLVEVSHTDFTKVTRMELVHLYAVVMLTTRITTTSWVLAVLSDTSVTSRDMSSVLARF